MKFKEYLNEIKNKGPAYQPQKKSDVDWLEKDLKKKPKPKPKPKDTQMSNKLKTGIKNIMKKSYMDFDDDSKNHIEFVTRENGNIGSETTGREDIQHAIKMGKMVIKKYPELKANLEEVDEWVSLIFTMKK